MSSKKFDTITRTAIWRANSKKCFYCNEYVEFRDLEIDHIIPEKISNESFAEIKNKLLLGEEFEINSLKNLVPTHHSCNNKKSDAEFSESSLRFYLELCGKNIGKIESELSNLQKRASAEKLLSQLSMMVDKSELSLNEIISYVRLSSAPSKRSSEPIVITFGINVTKYKDEHQILEDYVSVCDTLEDNLSKTLERDSSLIFIQSEESGRDGECISVRYVFWNINLNNLDDEKLSPWDILEISSYSEIYEDNWEDLFNKSIVEKYNQTICDDSDPIFGFSICPKCGSKSLNRSSSIDERNDELYYFIECDECDWSEWSQ